MKQVKLNTNAKEADKVMSLISFFPLAGKQRENLWFSFIVCILFTLVLPEVFVLHSIILQQICNMRRHTRNYAHIYTHTHARVNAAGGFN